MIYKLTNFSGEDVEKIFERIKLENKFNVLYVKNEIYIAYKNYAIFVHFPNAYKKIIRGLKISSEKINDQDTNFSQEVKEWIYNQFVKLELEEYEYKNQEKLKSIMDTLQEIDKELHQKVENKKIEKEGEA